MLVWNHLKKMANILGKTIAQLKHQLLSKYLVSELKYPAIKMTVVEVFIDTDKIGDTERLPAAQLRYR